MRIPQYVFIRFHKPRLSSMKKFNRFLMRIKEILLYVIFYRHIRSTVIILYQKKILIYYISLNHLCIGVFL